jgi:RNase H-like domain found in reverse transcriptase
MTLAFSDPDKRICVLTDISDRFYAGLVTQIDEEQLDPRMEDQDHQPPAFLSGEFKGAQLRWYQRRKVSLFRRHSDQGGIPFSKS